MEVLQKSLPLIWTHFEELHTSLLFQMEGSSFQYRTIAPPPQTPRSKGLRLIHQGERLPLHQAALQFLSLAE